MTDGFAFVEFTDNDPERLALLFRQMGFCQEGVHRYKKIALFRQNNIRFILNTEPSGCTERFRTIHGPGICSVGFHAVNARDYFALAIQRGAIAKDEADFNLPAIAGIGGSLIYFMDSTDAEDFFAGEFSCTYSPDDGALLTDIDHLTHNVHRGNLSACIDFYRDVLGFHAVRSFEINGQMTGLLSQVMQSPCGKIRIPINESTDDRSQIEEFLKAYNGEGIQHVALASSDIYHSIDRLKASRIPFLTTPDSYYRQIDQRFPNHGENGESLHRLGILLDGGNERDRGKLLQIFTSELIGPIFFEVIQRKGNQGFGEGNFQALFQSIELNQIQRGTLAR